MAREIVREIHTDTTHPRAEKEAPSHITNHAVYWFLGILEAMLLFRFVFKLLGANPKSGFVSFVYGISTPFVIPFRSIFGEATTGGAETTAVLEPSTLIAMAVYALVAWAVARFILIAAGRPHEET